MGVYIYPYDSSNFSGCDLGTLSNAIGYWLSNSVTPFVGGDFNSRPGDLNVLSMKSLKWRYEDNSDTYLNQRGKRLHDLCEFIRFYQSTICMIRYSTGILRTLRLERNPR